MLNEMELGEAAIKKMAENDASRGLVDPSVKRGAEARYKAEQEARAQAQQVPEIQPFTAPADGALSDRDLAANMLAQAKRMELEAENVLKEAARMKKDAERMHPGVVASELPPAQPAEAKRGRGRPPKSSVAADNATI